MKTIIAVLALTLLLTGVAITTAYAAPILAGTNGTQEKDQTQTQQRLRDGSCGFGDCQRNQTQTQDGLGEQTGNCFRNCFRNGQ